MSAILAIPCGDVPRLLDACAVPARAITLDLADAPPEHKSSARAQIASCVQTIKDSGKIPYVRMNSISSNFWKDDLDALVGTHVDNLSIPNVESPEELRELDEVVRRLGLANLRYNIHVENAEALGRLEEIVRASKRVDHVGIGLNDMCRNHGMNWEQAMTTQRPLVNQWRAQLVLVSHACGIKSPRDTAWMRITDQEGLRADAMLGRLLGFGEKTAVHPCQVAIINEVYQAT